MKIRILTLVKLKASDFIEYEREWYQTDISVFSIVIFVTLVVLQEHKMRSRTHAIHPVPARVVVQDVVRCGH